MFRRRNLERAMALIECPSVTVSRCPQGWHGSGGPDLTVVWLRGEQDGSTIAALIETLAEVIGRDDADVVVDLSGVGLMDAETVEVLVRARDFLGLHSRPLKLRAPSPCASRALDLIGLGELLDPAEVTHGTSGALGTWVAVPATARAEAAPDIPAEGRVMTPSACERAELQTTSVAGQRGS